MGGFFSLDGPFYKFGSMLADVMILSFVWLFFSIPIFTIGASTTALFYVTTRRISNKEGYLLRDFWKSFRQNFLQATACWMLLVLLFIILLINIRNINIIGTMRVVVLPFQYCFALELFLMSIYVFPIIARFDLKFKELVKTAFFMANKHIFTSITCVVTGGAIWVGIYYYPLFAVIAIGVYAFAISYFIMRVFKKYRPEMDKDDPIED